jgi:alpha-N-arabinofuranosidase
MNLEGERNQMREELIDYPVLRTLPMVSATASKNAEGKIHISLSNIDLENELEVTINLGDVKATKAVGEILTSAKIDDYNTFENPNLVKPAAFNEAKVKKGVLKVKLPAKSIVTLQLQ